MNLFTQTLKKQNSSRPPVWLMRQAGRYHSHYQELKKRYTFMELCKKPEVACETTMGPIQDFDFDAAILFSDLLFPLEVLGTGLRYDPGPKLDRHLETVDDLKQLRTGGESLAKELQFQADAMKLIRKALPSDKGLLGFVGGPLTLFCYAVEGSHQGELESSRRGLKDGRFQGFVELLTELLAENMAMQARAGADTIAVMDTCAGEVSIEDYHRYALPALHDVLRRFKEKCPQTPVTYYSKKTGPSHWECLIDLPIEAIGVDWNHRLSDVLYRFSDRFAIQGNIDPNWLFLPSDELESRLREVWNEVAAMDPIYRRGWICGLGHGVLPGTPENNVRLFLKLQKEIFGS